MTEHLPECPQGYAVPFTLDRCICDELRTCEQRVKRVERPLSFLKGATYGRDCGWDEALDAAEAAVNEVLDRTPNAMNGEYITVSKHFPADLIAAIRVLKEKP